MNRTLQAQGERTLYPLPPGLGELVNDITREVLRHQPTNVNQFIAEYLASLLRLRTALGVSVQVGAGVVQESENFVNHFLRCGVSHQTVECAARVIQSAVRGSLARRLLARAAECRAKRKEKAAQYGEAKLLLAEMLNVGLEELEEAAKVIERTFREYLDRQLEATSELDEEAISSLSALTLDVGNWVTQELKDAGVVAASEVSGASAEDGKASARWEDNVAEGSDSDEILEDKSEGEDEEEEEDNVA